MLIMRSTRVNAGCVGPKHYNGLPKPRIELKHSPCPTAFTTVLYCRQTIPTPQFKNIDTNVITEI